jgi:hypothetical protein
MTLREALKEAEALELEADSNLETARTRMLDAIEVYASCKATCAEIRVHIASIQRDIVQTND